MQTNELLNSDIYLYCIENLKNRGVKVLEPRPSDLTLSDEDIALSCFQASDIHKVLVEDGVKVIAFFLHKNKLLKSGDVEEYPKNEMPPEEEKPVLLGRSGYSYSVVLLHALEYLYLATELEKYGDWLKVRRIPKFKTYMREMKKIFAAALALP